MQKLIIALICVVLTQLPLSVSAAEGDIKTVAGGGVGDGLLAINAALFFPAGITMDSAGNFYIADDSNNRIRKVDSSGVITTVAGTDTKCTGCRDAS